MARSVVIAKGLSVALLLGGGCWSGVIDSPEGSDGNAPPGADAPIGGPDAQGPGVPDSSTPLPDGATPPADAAGPPVDGASPCNHDGTCDPDEDVASCPDDCSPLAELFFATCADTKSGTSSLSEISGQLHGLGVVLVMYPGDLMDGGYTQTMASNWTRAMNGGSTPGNGLASLTFSSRGNHDTADTAGWKSYFDFQGQATAIGATHFSAQDSDLTYSFDVGNSHFVALDSDGSVATIPSAAITWLDADLAAAEGRGLTHAFIMTHGPEYPVGGHCCSDHNDAYARVLGSHPIVSATFNGHEHNQAYVHIDDGRIHLDPPIAHEWEEVHSGSAGASAYDCTAGRTDWCQGTQGFATLRVSGNTFTVSWYARGNNTPIHTETFTK